MTSLRAQPALMQHSQHSQHSHLQPALIQHSQHSHLVSSRCGTLTPIPALSCSDQALLGPEWTLWLSWSGPWDLGSARPCPRSQRGLECSLIPTHIHLPLDGGFAAWPCPIPPGLKHLRGSFLTGILGTLPHPCLVPSTPWAVFHEFLCLSSFTNRLG